jgi:phage tail tape measure protein, TP901 family|nr:MAG TPA: minor tail protein [Caudoviricetes sp.]
MAQTTYDLTIKIGAKTNQSFKSTLNKAQAALSDLNSMSNVAMAGLTAATAGAATAAAKAISDATTTYKGFETEIKTVQAISQASASEFLDLKQAAMDAGRTTIFTATESASALEYMSLAGWDVQQSIEGLPGIIKMTAATGKELKTTSDLVTDSMSALSIGVDGMESYMDKLIQTNNKANTNAEQLMEALIGSGGAAKTLGVSLDDTITSLGIFANNGKKDTEAGTALNSMFVRLAGNAQAIKELANLKVDIWDQNGKFIGFEETLERINAALSNMTDEQRSMSMKKLAGTHYYSEMAYLLDSVNAKDGQESAFAALKSQIEGSQGALDKMYETTTDTLEVSEKLFQSAKEDMQIQFIDLYSDNAKEFVSWAAEKLPVATDALVEFGEAHRADFADLTESAEQGIEKFWNFGMEAGDWLLDNKQAVIGGLKGVALGIGLIKAATVGLSIVKSLTNPVTAAGLALWGGVTAFGAIRGAIQDAEDAARDANLAEHFGKVNLSLEELDALARQIVGEDSLNGVSSMLKSAAETASAIEAVTDVWTELQKNSWKVNIGFNMDTDDYEAYGKTIEKYISSVQDYAEDKGYEVHIAATLLFGEDSGQDAESSAFFASLQQKLEEYGASLHDYLYDETNGALLDGIIDIDEDAIVQEYLAKISNITAAISDAENAAKLESLTLKYGGADLTPDSMAQLQDDLGDYIQESQEGAQQAYESLMTEYHARLALDPSYTQQDFDTDSGQAWEAYYKAQTDAAMSGINYMLNTLHDAYPELEGELEQYQKDIDTIIANYTNKDNISDEMWQKDEEFIIANIKDEIYQATKDNPVEKDRSALSQYLEQMQSTADSLIDIQKAYEAAGEDVPSDIQDFIKKWDMLNSLVNVNKDEVIDNALDIATQNNAFQRMQIDEASMYMSKQTEDLETTASGSESSKKLTNPSIYEAYNSNMAKNGLSGLSAFSDDGVANYKKNTLSEIGTLRTWTEAQIEYFFSKDYSTEAKVNLTLEPSLTAALGTNRLYNGAKVFHNAQGGIYDKPILTTFAENGAEAAVPLDGSSRAKDIWTQAGEILGMFQPVNRDGTLLAGLTGGNSGSNSSHSDTGGIQISFNPNIVVQGNATREEIQKGLELSMDDLREMIVQIQKENSRVSFNM